MKRRDFIKDAALASAGMSLLPGIPGAAPPLANKYRTKILNAYYLRAHMYTIVPRQIKEDLQWMADIGTNVVSVAILEQDLFAAVENVQIICNEAEKLNIQVYAVPSRWGGITAGAPKVPSLFSVRNPQTWILKKDGTPAYNDVSGVISSVHYPETASFFKSSLDKAFGLWPLKGVIWDEPKAFTMDYSYRAIANMGKDATFNDSVKAVVDFFSDINKHIKFTHPEITTCLFSYADSPDIIVTEGAKTAALDYYGCDGRPWRNEDGGKLESPGKVLLGNGGRYLSAAHDNQKKSLWLIENHNLMEADIALMNRRLPEIIDSDVDHLIYYYYPRNSQNPDKAMKTIARHLKGFK
ncbi:hypothetical protein [Mucilaginibacter ginsenosidivorax]|uniref:Uncharacterized protein n=1 Tax=Mucilaginibacter ginsenosidivorax TaxID=862126 RepID=A0A5B8W431_9SPHI|nr:hypothetical protein [Mucilaginibacter ginsenosidivorax]QEC78584.1 hypothetical protein FSB76_22515 [Mucilaginibacter ginsenosidivorax]